MTAIEQRLKNLEDAVRLLAAYSDRAVHVGQILAREPPPAEPECTGITARHCPKCGDCRCDGEGFEDPACPLHAMESPHGEAAEPTPPEPAKCNLGTAGCVRVKHDDETFCCLAFTPDGTGRCQTLHANGEVCRRSKKGHIQQPTTPTTEVSQPDAVRPATGGQDAELATTKDARVAQLDEHRDSTSGDVGSTPATRTSDKLAAAREKGFV